MGILSHRGLQEGLRSFDVTIRPGAKRIRGSFGVHSIAASHRTGAVRARASVGVFQSATSRCHQHGNCDQSDHDEGSSGNCGMSCRLLTKLGWLDQRKMSSAAEPLWRSATVLAAPHYFWFELRLPQFRGWMPGRIFRESPTGPENCLMEYCSVEPS